MKEQNMNSYEELYKSLVFDLREICFRHKGKNLIDVIVKLNDFEEHENKMLNDMADYYDQHEKAKENEE